MKIRHDPLAPKPRQRKARETPDETERRLNADLRLLMNDKRYQENDRDFLHFVQRQFRRVYEDPSGEPQKTLRVGRPETFVTGLEPFDRAREQRLRRGAKASDTKVRQGVTGRSTLSDAARIRPTQNFADRDTADEEVHDIIPYWERAIGTLGPQDRTRSTPFPGIRDVDNDEALKRYQAYLDELEQRPKDVADARRRSWLFIQSASMGGYDEAVRAHEHYLEGSGEPLTVDAEVVRNYGPVKDAENGILGHLNDWFRGKLSDPRFGRPWLGLADGERIVVGDEAFDRDMVGGLVRWEAGFDGPTEDYHPDDENSEARMTFNAGTLESFSQITFERHGDRIEVSGWTQFRVADRYDFEKGHRLRSKVLEEHGGAKSFDIHTGFWNRPFSGWIEVGGLSEPRVHLTYGG